MMWSRIETLLGMSLQCALLTLNRPFWPSAVAVLEGEMVGFSELVQMRRRKQRLARSIEIPYDFPISGSCNAGSFMREVNYPPSQRVAQHITTAIFVVCLSSRAYRNSRSRCSSEIERFFLAGPLLVCPVVGYRGTRPIAFVRSQSPRFSNVGGLASTSGTPHSIPSFWTDSQSGTWWGPVSTL
ncbi:hypothetical protein EJ04DRAFT_306501 [Polyplosphaeria fusca]|uniref:Secreted protein n=1 Tax=Polyplosphaeria fusca TaxID=682080 RepID=A0A9P4V118_9PLEO|nr:hypothetical protein EJ04DRAFT_306501 [Polyplosphaeria fusca]